MKEIIETLNDTSAPRVMFYCFIFTSSLTILTVGLVKIVEAITKSIKRK